MRVLHVIPTYVPSWRHGGAVTALHGLSRALVGLGHEVVVVTTNVDGDSCAEVPLRAPVLVDGVTVIYLPVRWPRKLYWAPGARPLLERECNQADVIHCHALFNVLGQTAGRCCERSATPYVLSPHGMLVTELLRRRGFLRKRAWLAVFGRSHISRASALVVSSRREDSDLRHLQLLLPPVKIVPFGVEVASVDGRAASSAPSQLMRVLDQGPYVLYLGRITWKKGIDRLLAALPLAPGARLVVAGNDDEQYWHVLERAVRNHRIEDRVSYVGPVTGAAKDLVLSRASMLALPSRSENFAMVVLEAMAVGVPVVVTPEVGLAEEVEAGGAGLVVDGTPESFATAITRLLKDPDGRAAIGARGQSLARERFAWPIVAKEMLAVYEEVIEQSRQDGTGPVSVT